MTNPFDGPVTQAEVLWSTDCMTPAQAAYAAHAINLHERYAALLVKLTFSGRWIKDAHGDDIRACPCCDRPYNDHAPDCEMAALLAEEDEFEENIK